MSRQPPLIAASRDIVITGGTIVNIGTTSTCAADLTNRKLQPVADDERRIFLKELQAWTAPDAIHSSAAVTRQNICTPGTRTFTLQSLRSLVTSTHASSPDIVWLHGPAGAGKSAIMRTLASELSNTGDLLASFFFYHSEATRNTSIPLVPTLARQASAIIPTIQPSLVNSMKQHYNLFSQPPHLQCIHLLEAPLIEALSTDDTRWTPGRPLSMLIDGLDECTDIEAQAEIVQGMAHLAANIQARTDRRIKIIMASRPERQVKAAFALLRLEQKHDLCLNSANANIHLYLDQCFDEIRMEHCLPDTWPPAEDIEWLTDKTSGQYGFVGISTRFLKGGDPVARMKILRGSFAMYDLDPYKPLDTLYTTVFKQLPPEMMPSALLILRLRLFPEWSTSLNPILERLLQLPMGYTRRLAPYLPSLIDFTQPQLTPYHASLADFLTEPSRSSRFGLHVDNRSLCTRVVKGLLVVLVPELAANVEVTELTLEERDLFSSFIMQDPRKLRKFLGGFPIALSGEPLERVEKLDICTLDLWSTCFLNTLRRRIGLVCSMETHYPAPLFNSQGSIWDAVCKRIEDALSSRLLAYQEANLGNGRGELVTGLILLFLTTLSLQPPADELLNGSVWPDAFLVHSLLDYLIRSNTIQVVDSTKGLDILNTFPAMWNAKFAMHSLIINEELLHRIWEIPKFDTSVLHALQAVLLGSEDDIHSDILAFTTSKAFPPPEPWQLENQPNLDRLRMHTVFAWCSYVQVHCDNLPRSPNNPLLDQIEVVHDFMTSNAFARDDETLVNFFEFAKRRIHQFDKTEK